MSVDNIDDQMVVESQVATTNFSFFNDVIQEQITAKSSNAESHAEEVVDSFNYTLKIALESMLNSLLLVENEAGKSSHYSGSVPTVRGFHMFIKELFEIVQSPEKLNFALKFIIDTILEDEFSKYSRETVGNFVNKLICSNGNKVYPDDYLDDSIYISKFCKKYILLSKSSSRNIDYYEKKFSLLAIASYKKAPYLFSTEQNSLNVSLPTFLDETDSWAHLFFLVDSLKLDKTALVNESYSDFVQKTIFVDIKYLLIYNSIGVRDFLQFLFKKMAISLSRDETEMKTPNGDWRFILIFLKQHPYFKSFQQYFKNILVEEMLINFRSILESYKKINQEDSFDNANKYDSTYGKKRRVNKIRNSEYLQQCYEKNVIENESYVLVSLTLVNEGLLDLHELMEEFSKANSLNQELKDELTSNYKKFLQNQNNLNTDDESSMLHSLASASVLTTESDTVKGTTSASRFSNQRAEKSESPPLKNDTIKEKEGFTYGVSLSQYPQVMIISQLLERGLFEDAVTYMNYFKYSLFVVEELAEKVYYCANECWRCIKDNTHWKETSYNEQAISINTPYNFPNDNFVKKWEYWGSFAIPDFNKNDLFKSIKQFFKIEIQPTTVEQLLNILKNAFIFDYSCNTYNEEEWIHFFLNYLSPTIIKNTPTANDELYSIINHFTINQRFEIYKRLETSVIKDDDSLRAVNIVQRKQIKRFLKIINVDTISEQSVELAKLANVNPFTVFEECLRQAESYDMISTLIVESASGFSEFALDVLQYSCLKRMEIDRVYMAQDDVNVLPWLGKLTTFIISVYNLNSLFKIDFIFNNAIENVVKMEYKGLFILKEFLSKTTNSFYLDEPQDELAILLEASKASSTFAKSKLLGITHKESTRLLALFKQRQNESTVAQKVLSVLIAWPLDIFYDSFQTVSSIASKYDTVNSVLRLMIDFIKSNVPEEEFAMIFNFSDFDNSVAASQLLSNSWRRILFSHNICENNMASLNLIDCPENTLPLVNDFWRYGLKDLAFGASKTTPVKKFNLSSVEKSYCKIAASLNKYHGETYNNEGLKYFLEECVFKNSIIGVAEAIYSAEFIFSSLDFDSLCHVLTILFTRDYLKRLVISTSSNETLFLSVFIKRVFLLLNKYDSNLNGNGLIEFKNKYFYWTKCFIFEISDLILDYEYLNSRSAIQIVSESVHHLLPVDILIHVLLKTINEKLSTENREELIAPLNSLIGFSKTKLSLCKTIESFSETILEDEDVETMIATSNISNRLEESNAVVKDKDNQIAELEAQQKSLLNKIELKKEELKKDEEEHAKEEAELKEIEEAEVKELEVETRQKRRLEEGDDNVIKRRKFEYATDNKAVESRFEGFTDAAKPVTIAPKGRFGGTEEISSSFPSAPASRLLLPSGPKSKTSVSLDVQKIGPDDLPRETKTERIVKQEKPPISFVDIKPERCLLILKNILKEDKFTGLWISKLFAELEQERMIDYFIDMLINTDVDLIEFFILVIQNIFSVNFSNQDYSKDIRKLVSQVLVSLNAAPSKSFFVKGLKEYRHFSKFRYDPYSSQSFIEQANNYKMGFVKARNNKIKETGKSSFSSRGDRNSKGGNDIGRAKPPVKRFDTSGGSRGSRFEGSETKGYPYDNRRNKGYKY